MKISTLLAGTVLSGIVLFAGEYIVPKEYDNTYNSIKSQSYGLIHNRLTTLSSTTRSIGGKSGLHYRCIVVPKIQCRAAVPTMAATISDISLREPAHNKLMIPYATDLFVEDGGANWRVCAAAIGGLQWDDVTLTSQKTSTGKTKITLNYYPLKENMVYYYFTDDANHGSDSSYMVVEMKQVCQ